MFVSVAHNIHIYIYIDYAVVDDKEKWGKFKPRLTKFHLHIRILISKLCDLFRLWGLNLKWMCRCFCCCSTHNVLFFMLLLLLFMLLVLFGFLCQRSSFHLYYYIVCVSHYSMFILFMLMKNEFEYAKSQ